MTVLSKLFNARRVKSIPTELLLDTVKPFLKESDTYTNQDIADGWDEAIDWLRIGFHYEVDKGSNYQAMRRAMILIKRQIEIAPEGETIDIKKDDLAILRSCYFQLEQAAQYLEAQERYAGERPERVVTSRTGHELKVPFKQIYNKPQSDYLQAAEAVRQFSRNLDALFTKFQFREVHHMTAMSYAQQHPK